MKKINQIYLAEIFISNVLFALSFQYIYIRTAGEINSKIFPMVSILSCLFSIFFTKVNKKSLVLFNNFEKFAIVESVLYVFAAAFCIFTERLILFQVLSMFYCCILKQATGVAMIRFNEKIYRTPEQRQQYDNNVRICYDGSVVVAAILAFFLIEIISTELLIIIGTFAVVFDNICVIYIKMKLKEFKNETNNCN